MIYKALFFFKSKQEKFHLTARVMARLRYDTYAEIRGGDSQSDLRILL